MNGDVVEPEIPDIPDDATKDVPSPNAGTLTDMQVPPKDRHEWDVENFKNSAALWVSVGCLVAVAVFSLVEAFCQSGGDSLSRANDVFKMVATTALGYLFGRNSGGKH